MARLTRKLALSTPDASTWPAWTDAIRAELPPGEWPHWTNMVAPDPTGDDDEDPGESRMDYTVPTAPPDDIDDGPLDEGRAIESFAMDAIERSLIAPDLADALSRGSLAGLADAILHRGSDPRSCMCEACVWTRTARYAYDTLPLW